MNPAEFERLRDKVQQRLREEFCDVTRDGGVSWSQTEVIDDWGTDEQERAARASDRDRDWLEVANDPLWPKPNGSFSFLDPIGFRYYLAAAMFRALHTRSTHVGNEDLHFVLDVRYDKHRRAHFKLFTPGQRDATRLFIESVTLWAEFEETRDEWTDLLYDWDATWKRSADGTV